MAEAALSVSSTSDSAAVVAAVADNDEQGAQTGESKFVSEKVGGSSSTSFEHPQSSRVRLLEALAEAESELSTERVVTNEPSEEAEVEQETGDIDIAEVRRVATSDAIEAARRQQQERDDYYRAQQNQHLSNNPQAEIQALRAELLPAFQAKLQAQIADADVAQLREGASIPLSWNLQVAERLKDCFIVLPGGVEAAVYLMRNPQEVRQIAALPEHLAQARIVQLANRFNPAAQSRMSAAPPPIRPIGGSATTSAVPLDEADYQVYKREREKQIRARRR